MYDISCLLVFMFTKFGLGLLYKICRLQNTQCNTLFGFIWWLIIIFMLITQFYSLGIIKKVYFQNRNNDKIWIVLSMFRYHCIISDSSWSFVVLPTQNASLFSLSTLLISCLMMIWLLAPSNHHQMRHWLHRQSRSSHYGKSYEHHVVIIKCKNHWVL